MTKLHSPDLRIQGGKKLQGVIEVSGSKNGSVALLCASLLNTGTTRLKNIAKIEEVYRILEILEAIGVSVSWEASTLVIIPPKTWNPQGLTHPSFSLVRAGIMLIPVLAHVFGECTIPLPGGCKMGKRTLFPHINSLGKLGINLTLQEENIHISLEKNADREIILYEMSDTGTCVALLAAAQLPNTTTISFASANYQVQELCFFLEKCGVQIDGIGTSIMRVQGVREIQEDLTYSNSEDPIEGMTFIAAAATTGSSIRISRAPIDFLKLELFKLETMNFNYSLSDSYLAENGRTRLVDITTYESELIAPHEKLHATPYPGINTDNLPLFVPIATQAEGTTLIHDWMWENRIHYLSELNQLGAKTNLLDPHRLEIQGKTALCGADITAPPALRPGVAILIAMLAAEGESILRKTYVVNRGYHALHSRLVEIGADITTIS